MGKRNKNEDFIMCMTIQFIKHLYILINNFGGFRHMVLDEDAFDFTFTSFGNELFERDHAVYSNV